MDSNLLQTCGRDECNYLWPLSVHILPQTLGAKKDHRIWQHAHTERKKNLIRLQRVRWCINCSRMPTQCWGLSGAFHILFPVAFCHTVPQWMRTFVLIKPPHCPPLFCLSWREQALKRTAETKPLGDFSIKKESRFMALLNAAHNPDGQISEISAKVKITRWSWLENKNNWSLLYLIS